MKKTKKIKLSTNEFPTVTSLDNLEVGKIYKTIMFGIFTALMYNRGVANGIIQKKVIAIKEMIQNGLFFMNVVHVEINLRGQIIDGHHRFMALQQMGLPINFIINMQPEFNCDDPSEILNNVSEYNEINSSWSDKDAYMSALGFNEPTAIAIQKLKMYVNDNAIDSNIFTPARIIALATKWVTGLGGRKQKRAVYCSRENADIINSNVFYDEVNEIIELIKFLEGNGLNPWFFVRAMKPMDWSGESKFSYLMSLLKSDNLNSLKRNNSKKNVTVKDIETYFDDLIVTQKIKNKSKRK